MAENIVIKKPKYASHLFSSKNKNPSLETLEQFKIIINIIAPGTTPKETISANESNCFPISE